MEESVAFIFWPTDITTVFTWKIKNERQNFQVGQGKSLHSFAKKKEQIRVSATELLQMCQLQ